MRPLFAILVAAAVLGTVHLFLSATAAPVKRGGTGEEPATGTFAVDVTLTFDAGPDAFALRADQAASLQVDFRGRTLLRETRQLPRGQILTISPVPDVKVGPNEFLISAVPQEEQDVVHAVRVRVLRDAEVMAEQWLAAEPGWPISDTLLLNVPNAPDTQAAGDLPAGH